MQEISISINRVIDKPEKKDEHGQSFGFLEKKTSN